jgi:hypothetical protein
VEERAEESAEEVLARLERYVESRRARSAPRIPDPPRVTRPAEVAPADRRGVDTLIPSRDDAPVRGRQFIAEVAPALLAVTSCAFLILLSAIFEPVVAIVLGVALILVGVVGLVRRIHLARAFTFGLVVAVVLIRFS